MGRVEMKILSFKHQIQFSDKPFVLEVKTLESTWFDDAHPITSISYNHYRNSVDVSTCTFTSPVRRYSNETPRYCQSLIRDK